jgi:hypothetical protein
MRERYYKPFEPPRKEFPRQIEMPLLCIADFYIEARTLLPESKGSQDDMLWLKFELKLQALQDSLSRQSFAALEAKRKLRSKQIQRQRLKARLRGRRTWYF